MKYLKKENSSIRIITLLLAVMLLLPTMLPPLPAFAATYTWQQNATMTLTENGGAVVDPVKVYDGSDGIRKMKIYEVLGGKHYTLTTSANNDYAVLFKVKTVRMGIDEYSYYYPDASVTLDNVTIKTKNPVQSDVNTGGKYAAMMFYQMVENEWDARVRLDILLKGTNTIELLDVKDDLATNSWAAMSVIGLGGDVNHLDSAIRNVNETDARLNLKADLPAARGKVSALHAYSHGDTYSAPNFYLGYDNYDHAYSNIGYKPPSGVSGWGDEPTTPTEVVMSGKTTIDFYASATHADTAAKYGDGIYIDGGRFRLAYGVDGDIYAESHGVRNDAGYLMVNNVNIRAGEVGIASYNATMSVNASAADRSGPKMLQATVPGRMEITGHKNANGTYNPVKQGIHAKGDIGLNGYGDIYIKAENEAIYADRESDTFNTDIAFGNKTNVIVEGSLSSPDHYCIYLPNARYSTLYVRQGAKLTVNAGYRAIHAKYHTYEGGSTTVVTTTEPLEGGAMFVGWKADFYDDAKFDANVVSDYLAEESSLAYMYFRGKNVFIHAKKAAMRDTVGIDRYSDTIPTYQCDDGTSWEPFGQRCSKPYFTTRTPATHVCANDGDYAFQPIDGTEKHSANCLACGEVIEGDCDFEYSSSYAPTATEVGYHYYWCKICNQSKVVEIPTHDCEQYCSEWTKDETNHYGKCTYTGCGVEFARNHNYGDWSFVNSLTKERACTVCGHKQTEDAHKQLTHILPKSPTCTSVGTKEAWHCGEDGCECYYADSNLSQKVKLSDLILPKTAHKYVNGKCTVCGETSEKLSFIYEEIDYYSESMNGRKYIAVAKVGDKTYAMGRTLNADGSRAAVEVTVKPNGVIEFDSADVQIFTFEYGKGGAPTSFLADGGYMAVIDGRIVIFEKQYAGLGTPNPIRFSGTWDHDTKSPKGKLYSEEAESPWTKSYIVLDATTLTFKPSADGESASVLMYREVCHHGDSLYHQAAVASTCIEQGTHEYWYCKKCNEYYVNGDLERPFELEGGGDIREYMTRPATGHSYGEDGVCKHCSMKRPVYRQISNLDDLKAMPAGTSYIIVIKDGAKTYAMFLPPECPFDIDRNRNELPDILETDKDKNGIPNGIKGYDLDKDGIEDYLQDINGDGKVDMEDWRELCLYRLSQQYYEAASIMPNFAEVTVQPDGSIVLADGQAMEFHLYPSGPWGPLGDSGGMMRMMSLESGKEGDIMIGGDERSDIDNNSKNWWAMFVPNYWVFHGGLFGEYGPDQLSVFPRFYGDYLFPGVIDNHNWYIEFNADKTACMVTGYENGLSREGRLKFVRYTQDGKQIVTIVGLSPSFKYSFTIDSSLPIYLYASTPEYTHQHTMSDWEDDGNGTHSRRCTHEGCPLKETEKHSFGEWTVSEDKTKHSRTCSVCGAVEQAEHSFGECTSVDNANHKHECAHCGYVATEAHEFDDWLPLEGDSAKHARECICGHSETEEHKWDKGETVTQPTHESEGEKKYTCTECGATRSENLPALSEHAYGDWLLNDRKPDEHYRRCVCGDTQYAPHSWGSPEIVEQATHTSEGKQRITCTDCGYFKETAIPALSEHAYGEWFPLEGTQDKHVRYCSCQQSETGECHFDAGVVTTEPTYEATGVMTYTCADCKRTKTETLEKLVKTDTVKNENYLATISVPTGSNAALTTNTFIAIDDVTEKVEEQAKAKIEILGGDGATVLASYDISLLRNGATYQPGGKVEVTLPIPEKTGGFKSFKVVYIDENNNVTECESRVNEDGTITFVTDHFSQYAIVGVPECSSATVWIIVSICAAVALAAAVIVVIIIKKKKTA